MLAHRKQLCGRDDAVIDFIAWHGGKVDAMTSVLQCKVCQPDSYGNNSLGLISNVS